LPTKSPNVATVARSMCSFNHHLITREAAGAAPQSSLMDVMVLMSGCGSARVSAQFIVSPDLLRRQNLNRRKVNDGISRASRQSAA